MIKSFQFKKISAGKLHVEKNTDDTRHEETTLNSDEVQYLRTRLKEVKNTYTFETIINSSGCFSVNKVYSNLFGLERREGT